MAADDTENAWNTAQETSRGEIDGARQPGAPLYLRGKNHSKTKHGKRFLTGLGPV